MSLTEIKARHAADVKDTRFGGPRESQMIADKGALLVHITQLNDALRLARSHLMSDLDAFDPDCGDAGCDDCLARSQIETKIAVIDAALER